MRSVSGLYELTSLRNRVLFHRETGRFALIDKDLVIEEKDYAVLTEKLRRYPRIEMFPGFKYGEGKITLSYMSARTCNMGCKYCFAGNGEYGNDPCKQKFFSTEKYLEGFNKALEIYKSGVERIDFFGGEPLLNFMEIKEFVPVVIKMCREKGMQRPIFSMTTNGTLIDEEIASFLRKYHFRISISVDGPKRINDSARLFKGSMESAYESVKRCTQLLKNMGVLFNISVTINNYHLKEYKKGSFPEMIEEISDLGYENVSFVPAVTETEELNISSKDSLEKLDVFTRDLINYYFDKICEGETRMIPSLLILPIIQIAKHEYMRNCSAGKSFLWDTDGKAYPCQMFCNDKEFCIGSLEEGISEDAVKNFLTYNREQTKECMDCIAKNVCSVWCKGIQYLSNHDIYKVCNERCVFQRAIVEESVLRLAYLREHPQKAEIFWNNYKRYQEKAGKDKEFYLMECEE